VQIKISQPKKGRKKALETKCPKENNILIGGRGGGKGAKKEVTGPKQIKKKKGGKQLNNHVKNGMLHARPKGRKDSRKSSLRRERGKPLNADFLYLERETKKKEGGRKKS